MRLLPLAALLLAAACAGVAPDPPLAPRPVGVALASPAEIRAFVSDHTTTFSLENETGPYSLSLALLADGTGWLRTDPLPGGRWQGGTRRILRWWVTDANGSLCVLYSPPAAEPAGRLAWSCYFLVPAPEGGLTYARWDGTPRPRIARLPGNALAGHAAAFEAKIADHGPQRPSPLPPLTRPPS